MKSTLRHIYMCRTANMSRRTCVVIKQIQSNQFPSFYYPRPVLAFGYWRCLRLCVCLCVNHNLGPIQARITKFEAKVQNSLFKVPLVLWSNRSWYSRSNLTLKSKSTHFELVHTIIHHPLKRLILRVKVKFNLKRQNFQFHHYLKYITTI